MPAPVHRAGAFGRVRRGDRPGRDGQHLGGEPPGPVPARAWTRPRTLGACAGQVAPELAGWRTRPSGRLRDHGRRRRPGTRRPAGCACASATAPRRPGADLRRHHPAGRRAAQRRLERRRAPHRPRDQEPADPDPALGRAAPAQVPQGDHERSGDLRPLHRHHHPPGRRHRPDGRRVLRLRAHAGAEVRASDDAAELLRQAVFAQRVADPGYRARDRRAAAATRRSSATGA